MANPKTSYQRPDSLQRVINGVVGGLLGAALGFLFGLALDDGVVLTVILGSVVCFALAFMLGDRIIEWLIRTGQWM